MEHTNLRGMRCTWSTSGAFCVAGAAQEASPERSATIDHYRIRILRGRPSTWTISVSFCVAGAPLEASPERSGEGCRRLITFDACCICVAGAALTSSPSAAFCVVGAEIAAQWLHFACQVELFGAPFEQLSGPNLAFHKALGKDLGHNGRFPNDSRCKLVSGSKPVCV